MFDKRKRYLGKGITIT